MKQNVDFALNSGADRVQFFMTLPFPGTPLFDLAQTNGKMLQNPSDGYSPYFSGKVAYETYNFTGKDVEEFAPPEGKFSIQRTLPESTRELTAGQRSFLGRLGEKLRPEMTGEEIHGIIYEVSKEAGLSKGSEAFEAIYRAFLDRGRGPRAGWFLAFLDRDFVISRLEEASTAGESS